MIHNEVIKIINHRPYWLAITLYILFCVLALFRVLIVDARTDLVSSLNDIMGFGIVVILLVTFIVTSNVGLNFRYNSIKFEIISGLTRTEEFTSNLLAVALQAFVLTLFLFLIAETYYWIVNGSMVLFHRSVLNFFLMYFFWNYLCACFVNAIVLITKHGTAAFLIVFTYIIIEVLLVEANVLTLETEALDKLGSSLLLGSMFKLLTVDILAVESSRIIVIPLLYYLLFTIVSYVRLKTMPIS